MKKLRYSRFFKNTIAVIIFGMLLFGGVFVLTVVAKIQFDDLTERMESVEATVIDTRLHINRRGPDDQDIFIEYEVDGVVYSRELKTDTAIAFSPGVGASYSVGDKVGILYDPQDPQVIASPRSVATGRFYRVIGLGGFGLTGFGLYYMMAHHHKFLMTQEEYVKEGEDRKKAKEDRKKQKAKMKAERKNRRADSKKGNVLSRDLRNIKGEKIRWQYFTGVIYTVLTLVPMVPIIVIIMNLKKGNFDFWAEVTEYLLWSLMMYSAVLLPFIVLAILNRFCFGKILAVSDGKTLYLENKEIAIGDIKEIVYNPGSWSRHRGTYSYATLIVVPKEGKKYSLDRQHFPMYGMRIIKKYNPTVKIRFDKDIWFFVFMPTVAGIIVALFK